MMESVRIILRPNDLSQAREAREPGKTARRNPTLPGANGSMGYRTLRTTSAPVRARNNPARYKHRTRVDFPLRIAKAEVWALSMP